MNKNNKIKNLNSTYSIIIIEKNGKRKNHIISNSGWFPLEYWIKKFENKEGV